MADGKNSSTTDLNDASLLLLRLHGVLDTLMTLAFSDNIGGLCHQSLVGVLDEAMDLTLRARDIVDAYPELPEKMPEAA